MSVRGIEATVALLKELSASAAPPSCGALARRAKISRASAYRIVASLAAAKILVTGRGTVAVGPKGAALAEIYARDLQDDDRPTPLHGAPAGVVPPPAPVAIEDAGPIALSAPFPVRSGRRYRIGFSNISLDNPWRTALVHSIEYAAASRHAHIARLTVAHARDDSTKQAEDIDQMVADGVDGLIVSAGDGSVMRRSVRNAMAKGVAVVLVDRGLKWDVPRTSFVTTDDAAIGRLTALWLAETLDGSGGLLLLPGRADAAPAQSRLGAARVVFGDFPGISIRATEWSDWSRDKAYHIVTRALKRWRGRISGVWCDSGLQGAGSLQAFVDAGYRRGEIPPHTGGDLNLVYKMALRYGVRLGAVDYPPAMGTRAVEVLLAALRGQWVPTTVAVPSEVILTRNHATRSVRAHRLAENHVAWDLPDDLVVATGIGRAYNPRSFRIHYPGNRYNRSAAEEIDA
jgi:ABC-type sugar transport system substrate-binding protein